MDTTRSPGIVGVLLVILLAAGRVASGAAAPAAAARPGEAARPPETVADGPPEPRSPLCRAPAHMVIDGDLAEWQAHPQTVLGCNGIYERSQAAEVWLAWDEKGLCVAARVWDDSLFSAPAGAPRRDRPRVRWPGGDALLLTVDLRDYAKQRESENPPYEFALKPLDAATDKPVVLAADRSGKTPSTEGAKIAARKTDDGWTLEALVPWTTLGGFDAAPGKGFLARVILFDSDKREDDEARNSAKVEWSTLVEFHTRSTGYELSTATPDMPFLCVAREMPFLERAWLEVEVAAAPERVAAKLDLSVEIAGGLTQKMSLPLRPSLGGRFLFARERVSLPIEKAPLEPLTATLRLKDAAGQTFTRTLTIRPEITNMMAEVSRRLPEESLRRGPEAACRLASFYRECALELAERLHEPRPDWRAEARRDIALFVRHAAELLDPNLALPDLRYHHHQAWRTTSDQSWQPFLLSVPEKIEPDKRYPLSIEAHGGSRYLTRPSWTARYLQRLDSGERKKWEPRKGSSGGFEIQLMGRGNAHLREGIEELEYVYSWARQNLPVDLNRVQIGGHSLGGRAALAFGVWWPDRWALVDARSPSAGIMGIAYRTDREREYLESMVGWNNKLANLRHTALRIVYGENEVAGRHQLPAVRAFMDGVNLSGLDFRFQEVPGKGHGYDTPPLPADFLAALRPEFPRHVAYYTGCLQFNKAWWVEIDLVDTAGSLAGIAANRDDANYIRVNTSNVRQLTLTPDREIDPAKRLRVLIDGQEVWIEKPERPLNATFAKGADGKWTRAEARWPAGRLVKRKGLCGPMREITHDGAMIVYGAGGGEDRWVLRHKADMIARELRGVHFVGNERSGARFVIKSDADVTDAELRANSLWLIGNSAENAVVARLQKDLPVTVGPQAIRIGGHEFAGKDYAINFIYPSPLNPERYVYVNAGLTPRSYNHTAANAHLYDYAVNLNDGLDNESLLLGVFNTDWRFDDELVIYRKSTPQR